MQRQVVAVLVLLLCCSLIYMVIWTNVLERSPSKAKDSQVIDVLGENFEFIWQSEKETLLNITVPAPVLNSTPNFTRKHLLDVTPIPILYKKNFTQMPKWDFEDVYMRSGEAPRQSVCSKSLQNTKDERFQEAALWNIQLWFYNGMLNVSEWNRLAHFNNPFGFMDYTYTDIKRPVDLIPKPKNNHILQVPKESKDGCIRCAVVGTGGIMYGSRMGKEIDSHDYVFRVNGAITKGFEEDVGNKTSVYVHTSFSLSQSTAILGKQGFKHSPQDEGIKYVMIPEGLRDFVWLESLLEKKRITKKEHNGYRPHTYYRNPLSEDQFYVLHPDFLRYIRNRFMPSKNLNSLYWALYRPTNGAFALFLALHTCDIVDVYGFITASHRKYSNYYYERTTKTRVIFYLNHDYELEIKTWKKLHDAGIINLYQREKELKPTM